MCKEDKDKSSGSYSHILKYTGIFGGVQGLNILVGIVRNKFTAVFLGPSGMGLLSLFTSTANFISSATNLGIPTSGVKVLANATSDGDGEAHVPHESISIVRTYSVMSACFGFLMCALLGPLLNLFTFGWGNHTLHFILLAPTIFFTVLAGGETAVLKAMGQLKALASQASLLAILSLLFSVPIYWAFGESGILVVLFLVAFCQWLLCFNFSRKVSPLYFCFSKKAIAKGVPMVRLGVAFVLAGMMNTGAEFLVRAFLNTQGDLELLGLFNAGVTIVIVYAGMVFSVLDSDYYPRLSSITGDRVAPDVVEQRSLCVNRQLEMNVLLIGPIIMAMVVALPVIILVLYDSKFMGMLQMTQVAALGMLFKGIYLPIEYLPLSRGESKVFLMQESFCVVLLISCEIVGFLVGSYYSQGGGIGAAPCYQALTGLGVGIVVAYAVEALSVMLFSRIYYHYKISAKALGFILFHLLCGVFMIAIALTDYHRALYWVLGGGVTLISVLFSAFHIRKSLKNPS